MVPRVVSDVTFLGSPTQRGTDKREMMNALF